MINYTGYNQKWNVGQIIPIPVYFQKSGVPLIAIKIWNGIKNKPTKSSFCNILTHQTSLSMVYKLNMNTNIQASFL